LTGDGYWISGPRHLAVGMLEEAYVEHSQGLLRAIGQLRDLYQWAR
jgi:hypothetical protein